MEKVTTKKLPGKPFVRGDPRAGRPKGRLNDATLAAKAWAEALIADKEHKAAFLEKWKTLDIATPLLVYIYQIAKGKPKEQIEVSGVDGGPVSFTLTLDTNDDRSGT